MLEKTPVITASEMVRLEKLALKEGGREEEWMEQAGKAVASHVIHFLKKSKNVDVTILAGKGNNGGDGYAAACELLKKGISVTVLSLYPIKQCSKLCQKWQRQFAQMGGECTSFSDKKTPPKQGILLDALVGTGFKGEAEGELLHAIEWANRQKRPILSIDIPSGLNGDTGEVLSEAIFAEETIYLELPKLGFFLKDGWDRVGKLVHAEFGLSKTVRAKANVAAYLLEPNMLAELLPPPKRTRHKYESGYVLAIAGSAGMSGAALLASYAALKSGAGIVRLFYPEEMKAEINDAPLELIKEAWTKSPLSRIAEESKRAKALLIGPGCGRTKPALTLMKGVLNQCTLPSVIDADALYLLAQFASMKLPKQAILTPHKKEAERLLKKDVSLAVCQRFVEKKRVTLLLKGAPSFIFHKGEKPLIMPRGDPAMATAGSGDVLTGIIAAMLAKGLKTRMAAAAGALLHGLAGEVAAKEKTSYGVVASDLINALSKVFKKSL